MRAVAIWAVALLSPVAAGVAAPAAHAAAGTVITLNGKNLGPAFDGIGAISGGGGNSRFLIDYPPAQQSQILHYLFGPGGADLQILKLEIGGDADSSDGAEPSAESSSGQIDCKSGYEWWLAEQALALNPKIKLYGLQWAAPGWVGSIWSQADRNYVIDWLNCAKFHHLHVSYLGGWNEHGYNTTWFVQMRQDLNAHGYTSVQLVAADAHPADNPYQPAGAWAVAAAAAKDPALKAAISVLGVHDTCDSPTDGYHCESTAAARKLGKPLWESELGALDANLGAAAMARSINNSYIQAGITGIVTWPLTDSMQPLALPYENRGLVTADQPWSGSYTVNRILWAIAQTTQFVQPGWRHLAGANKALGNSGTYNSYESPNHKDWSLVAENTSAFNGQHVHAQPITVHLTGGLADRVVHVRETNLWSPKPTQWFTAAADIKPKNGTFTYLVKPGYVVSFTSASGQSKYAATGQAAAPMPLPYQPSADGSNEASELSSIEGAFLYRPCLGGVSGNCLEQVAPEQPVWWQTPSEGTPVPYAIVGDPSWTNYTVSAKVLFTSATGTASLIGRFGQIGGDAALFSGYEFAVTAGGGWSLTRHSQYYSTTKPSVHTLASGSVAAFAPDTWHTITLTVTGGTISATVDGTPVTSEPDSTYGTGLAGIGSSWNLVQFADLTVS